MQRAGIEGTSKQAREKVGILSSTGGWMCVPYTTHIHATEGSEACIVTFAVLLSGERPMVTVSKIGGRWWSREDIGWIGNQKKTRH